MIHLPRISIDDIELIKIAKRNHISEIYLFGSVLREDFNQESDIDLMVVFDTHADYDYFDIMFIKDEFATFFHRNVDLVEKNAIRNPFRRDSILSTARMIYAA